MTAKNLPSPELLRKLLRYEPDTGKLYWRERAPDMFVDGKRNPDASCKMWNKKHAGKEALTTLIGYRYPGGNIFNRIYYAHRVIWAIFYGEWPSKQIDHINGNRCDNRIKNLRHVSHFENGKNQRLSSNNTSGFCGVSWYSARGKWQAHITSKGKKMLLGIFTNKSDAIAARKAAEVKYGFHANHGRQT